MLIGFLCFYQGETGPAGPSGAPGTRGTPVCVSVLVQHHRYLVQNQEKCDRQMLFSAIEDPRSIFLRSVLPLSGL